MQHILTLIFANPALPLSISLGVLIIYVFYLDHRITILTRGKNGATLEDTLTNCIASVATVEEKNEFISKYLLSLDDRLKTSVRNAHSLRYKALESSASNQSFSVALIDETGNGVVLSSLHHRDRTSFYAKPINAFESEFELTEEEQYVLNEAKEKNEKKKL